MEWCVKESNKWWLLISQMNGVDWLFDHLEVEGDIARRRKGRA